MQLSLLSLLSPLYGGTLTFIPVHVWGRIKYLLVFQDFGTASVGEVQYQGVSSLWQWPRSSLGGLVPSEESPPPRWLLWQHKLETLI